MGILELTNLMLQVFLIASGIIAVILILKVYSLYQTLKINRSVMTPMLFTGMFIAVAGFSELIEPHLGEIGMVTHILFMSLAAVSFIYGIYGYHKMLNRAIKLE